LSFSFIALLRIYYYTYIINYYYTDLHANSQIVFLDRFVVQRMVYFYIRPCETVVLPLLQVERVKLIRLRRGPWHQPIKHGRISFDARAENTETPISK